jgi:FKBP-type peptidyl-prolyl cis-trans isomerase SlyD
LTCQVGPDTRVALSYRAYDADGDEVDHSPPDAPLVAVFGYGQLLPAVEHAIGGLQPGQTRSIELPPSQAFGERDPRAVIEVDRADFPADVAPGDRYEVENQAGQLLVFKVLEVGEDYVMLDTNHPLAGQRVRIEVTIREARPATSEELSTAQARLLAPSAGFEPSLIGVERLLRGRAQG